MLRFISPEVTYTLGWMLWACITTDHWLSNSEGFLWKSKSELVRALATTYEFAFPPIMLALYLRGI